MKGELINQLHFKVNRPCEFKKRDLAKRRPKNFSMISTKLVFQVLSVTDLLVINTKKGT